LVFCVLQKVWGEKNTNQITSAYLPAMISCIHASTKRYQPMGIIMSSEVSNPEPSLF